MGHRPQRPPVTNYNVAGLSAVVQAAQDVYNDGLAHTQLEDL